MKFTHNLSLFVLTSTAFAEALEWKTVLGYGRGYSEYWTCDTYTRSDFVWDYTPTMLLEYSSYYDAQCDYPPAIGTILLCSASLANNDTAKLTQIFKAAASACGEYTIFDYGWEFYRDQYLNATAEYLPLNQIENATLPVYRPSLPDMTTVIPDLYGYNAYYWNLDSGTWYSVGICVYFLLLIIIGTIHNIFRKTSLTIPLNKNKISKYIQSYVTLPALFPHGSFSTPVGFTWFSALFPNRTQFLVETGLFILQVAFYSVSYRQDVGVSLFGSADAAWQRGVADRTGIMAFGKIPLLVLFSGRNNFLCWLTGWSYMTFIQYHKVLARWMFLDALIHSVAYTIMELGSYVAALEESYFACGVAATVLAGVMLLFSMHVFRRHFYEYFVALHVVLAIAFIIMCWYHCNTLGWCEWLVATSAVWVLDRLARVIRMAGFGYRTATITTAGDEIFKVEVPKPKWWIHAAGNYGFVYFANVIFWENNPFTIVNEGGNLCIYIKVKKGVTKRIWNKLLKNNGSMQCKVCIEGPYGGSNSGNVKRHNDLLMIAGGAGIPGILDCAINVKSGKLIWIVQELKKVQSYGSLISKLHNVEVDIYVTREQGSDKNFSTSELLAESGSDSEALSSENSSKENSGLEKTSLEKTGDKNVFVRYSKPDLGELIPKEVENLPGKSIGIIACGPPKLMDDLRHFVSKEIPSTNKSIDYFDEFQTW